MPLRHLLDKELNELNNLLINMGELVEKSINNTIIALETQDIEHAQKIFNDDDKIDELEQKIEKLCLKVIATQQPIAADLRRISTILKVITDMERIADHSSDIAEMTIQMINTKYDTSLAKIIQMSNLAKKMVHDAIDSYIKQDVKLAMKVCSSDDDVDNLFLEITIELANSMKDDRNIVEQSINLMFIAKYLERMADHATNIAEWVVYNVTGEHEHLTKHLHKNIIDDPLINEILNNTDQ